MTDVRTENLRLLLEHIARIKPDQNLLVIADDYVRPLSLARDITNLANSMGIEAVLSMMKVRRQIGEEPPRTVAAAMKVADVIVSVSEGPDIVHTNARKEATEMGASRIVAIFADISEDYLQKLVTLEDLNKIKERTDKLATILAKGNTVKVTTPHGTNLTMSIAGRPGRNLHPLSDYPIIHFPDFAEASVAPVEGTTEGLMVVDASLEAWGYLLRKPIRFDVKKGRVQLETISRDIPEETERLEGLLSLDEMACNFAAELGIGTSHTIPKMLRGSVMDFGMEGTVHIAFGRNNDFGGETWSSVHEDCLMTKATIEVDDICVMENGELKV